MKLMRKYINVKCVFAIIGLDNVVSSLEKYNRGTK